MVSPLIIDLKMMLAGIIMMYVGIGGMIAAYCSIPDDSGETIGLYGWLQLLCFWPYVVYLARKEDIENERME